MVQKIVLEEEIISINIFVAQKINRLSNFCLLFDFIYYLLFLIPLKIRIYFYKSKFSQTFSFRNFSNTHF